MAQMGCFYEHIPGSALPGYAHNTAALSHRTSYLPLGLYPPPPRQSLLPYEAYAQASAQYVIGGQVFHSSQFSDRHDPAHLLKCPKPYRRQVFYHPQQKHWSSNNVGKGQPTIFGDEKKRFGGHSMPNFVNQRQAERTKERSIGSCCAAVRGLESDTIHAEITSSPHQLDKPLRPQIAPDASGMSAWHCHQRHQLRSQPTSGRKTIVSDWAKERHPTTPSVCERPPPDTPRKDAERISTRIWEEKPKVYAPERAKKRQGFDPDCRTSAYQQQDSSSKQQLINDRVNKPMSKECIDTKTRRCEVATCVPLFLSNSGQRCSLHSSTFLRSSGEGPQPCRQQVAEPPLLGATASLASSEALSHTAAEPQRGKEKTLTTVTKVHQKGVQKAKPCPRTTTKEERVSPLAAEKASSRSYLNIHPVVAGNADSSNSSISPNGTQKMKPQRTLVPILPHPTPSSQNSFASSLSCLRPSLLLDTNSLSPRSTPPNSILDARRRKECTVENCHRQAKKGGVCLKHGATVRRPQCKVLGCVKQAQNQGLCIAHGARVRRCRVDGCKNNGLVGHLCISHGAKIRRCRFEGGCAKHAQLGGLCVSHGAIVRRCKIQDCSSQARKGGVCRLHKRSDC